MKTNIEPDYYASDKFPTPPSYPFGTAYGETRSARLFPEYLYEETPANAEPTTQEEK